jgi:hypothetical protein
VDKIELLSNLDNSLEQIAHYVSSNDPRNFPDQYLASLLNLKSSSAALAGKDGGVDSWKAVVEMAVVTGRLEPLVDACVAVCEANEGYGSASSLFDVGFMFLALFGHVAEDQVRGQSVVLLFFSVLDG